MTQESFLSAPVLEQFLLQARFTRATASLRLQEAHARLLGDLRVHRFRAGMDLELSGLHPRDHVPEEGTSVTLTILLGDEVLSLDATLLAPTVDAEGTVILRLHWPMGTAHLHRRRDMRVAGPDQSPLKARITLGDRTLDALVVNLTETGVGLARRSPCRWSSMTGSASTPPCRMGRSSAAPARSATSPIWRTWTTPPAWAWC